MQQPRCGRGRGEVQLPTGIPLRWAWLQCLFRAHLNGFQRACLHSAAAAALSCLVCLSPTLPGRRALPGWALVLTRRNAAKLRLRCLRFPRLALHSSAPTSGKRLAYRLNILLQCIFGHEFCTLSAPITIHAPATRSPHPPFICTNPSSPLLQLPLSTLPRYVVLKLPSGRHALTSFPFSPPPGHATRSLQPPNHTRLPCRAQHILVADPSCIHPPASTAIQRSIVRLKPIWYGTMVQATVLHEAQEQGRVDGRIVRASPCRASTPPRHLVTFTTGNIMHALQPSAIRASQPPDLLMSSANSPPASSLLLTLRGSRLALSAQLGLYFNAISLLRDPCAPCTHYQYL